MSTSRFLLLLLVGICVTSSFGESESDAMDAPSPRSDIELTSEATELLAELAKALPLLRQSYESLSVEVIEKVSVFDETDGKPKESSRNVRVLQRGEDLFLVDSESGDANVFHGLFLVNSKGAWTLKRDRKSGKLFLSQEGKKLMAKHFRFDEWWVDAAFSFGISALEKRLFEENPRRRVMSVRSAIDEAGERVVEVDCERLPKISRPGDERHNVPFDQISFYRDHYWVLKEAEEVTYAVGTDIQLRKHQQCKYEPFAGSVPILRRVILSEYSRALADRDNDDQWKLRRVEDVEFVKVTLSHPNSDEFLIERYLPNYGRAVPSRSESAKWIFLTNGMILLALWFFVRRRNRNAQESRR